jgi:RNA polymerase sigma-70 factor, ECF subfamily
VRKDKGVEYAARLPGLRPAAVAATMPRVSERVSDGDLIQRVGDGDRNAFEALYRRFARPVFGLALRRLGDRGRAEDALQETFTSIWRAASTYSPERGPGAPWLYAVARNAIVDRSRGRFEIPADPPEEEAVEPGPPEQAEASWLSWRIHLALAELPEHERTVVELAYWSGLSQSEVATFLNIPLGTVKTRTRSALARLANALDEELQ